MEQNGLIRDNQYKTAKAFMLCTGCCCDGKRKEQFFLQLPLFVFFILLLFHTFVIYYPSASQSGEVLELTCTNLPICFFSDALLLSILSIFTIAKLLFINDDGLCIKIFTNLGVAVHFALLFWGLWEYIILTTKCHEKISDINLLYALSMHTFVLGTGLGSVSIFIFLFCYYPTHTEDLYTKKLLG